jgi:hypothetical protein
MEVPVSDKPSPSLFSFHGTIRRRYGFLDRALMLCADDTSRTVISAIIELDGAHKALSDLRGQIGSVLDRFPWPMDGADGIRADAKRMEENLSSFIEALHLYVLTLTAGRSMRVARKDQMEQQHRSAEEHGEAPPPTVEAETSTPGQQGDDHAER